jgi:hypothetical protein
MGRLWRSGSCLIPTRIGFGARGTVQIMRVNTSRLIFLILFVIVLCAEASSSTAQAKSASTPHTFGWKGEHFLLDGQPFQILSGEMHYARVPRARTGATACD